MSKQCTEIEPCGWRWDEVWQLTHVCAHRHTQQTHRRWGMEGVKRWIVQVMHSLRLLSLVSHTMAPMHSLSTLSHVKNKKKKKKGHKHKLLLQCKKSEERGKRWRVLLLRQRASPAGKGADSWCCLQMLMDLDVCNKEEECQQLANKKMRVNKKKIQKDKPHEQGQAGAV